MEAAMLTDPEAHEAPTAEHGEFSFRGVDRWGIGHAGVQDVPVAAFVESKYETHWQWLTVEQDGVQVGGIQREDDGRLTWWAQR
jgi:hypothetical protein